MAIVVRYELRSAVSFTPIILTFQTQAAALHYIEKRVPAEARNLSVWREDEQEARQKPTYAYAPKTYTPWWDANKRPFSDRYGVNGERT